MTSSGSLTALADEWRWAADKVLDVARVEASLAVDDVVGPDVAVLREQLGAVPQAEVDNRVDALLNRSDELIAEIGEVGEGVDTIPVLLATLEVGNVLLVSSQDQAKAFETLGTDADGGVSLAVPSLELGDSQFAVVGEDTPAPVPLPAELTAMLDSLQSAGAKELVELGKDVVLQQVLGNMVTGVVSLGGDNVEKAFEWVKSKVNFIRQAAIRILKWVVDKFKSLVPKEIQDQVDQAVKSITGKLKDGVVPLVGALLGRLLGRADTEDAWRTTLNAGTDTTAAESKLETVISGHIKRIGYVSAGRTAVAGAAAVVKVVLSIAELHVRVVLGALAVALIGFVCWQLWDGFNDVERLV